MSLSATAALVLAGDPSCYSRAVNDWVCGDYLVSRRGELLDHTLEHIYLTVVSVALGLAIALPLAVVARRFTRLEGTILGATTVLYTIPSLAMFSLLVVVTGLSAWTTIIGLALYSLTILVRNALAGLRAVPDDVRDAALGLGYGPTRLLLRVELPLALPVIMAGLRVATVSTVALVTIGSIVSYGGLGNMLKLGIESTFKAQVLTTSVLCVILAVVFDLALVVVQQAMTPWMRGRR